MILIDTNSLIVLIIGLIDSKLIEKHKRTSIYEEQDFFDMLAIIPNFNKLVILPNVWTEVDNLLNNFTGNLKVEYVEKLKNVITESSEKFLQTIEAVKNPVFYDLGVTDTLLLEYGKKCKLLISSDSALSDYAIANGIKVYDMVKLRNERLL